MVDRRARRGIPERWTLPPAPRDEPAASRWAELPFDRRRSLARVRADDLDGLSPEDREVVAALQRARLATRWRLLAAAPILAWLVLMTFWGFGRSTYPESEGTWLLVGLVLGAVAWFVVALASAARLRRARATLASATEPDDTANDEHDHTPTSEHDHTPTSEHDDTSDA